MKKRYITSIACVVVIAAVHLSTVVFLVDYPSLKLPSIFIQNWNGFASGIKKIGSLGDGSHVTNFINSVTRFSLTTLGLGAGLEPAPKPKLK